MVKKTIALLLLLFFFVLPCNQPVKKLGMRLKIDRTRFFFFGSIGIKKDTLCVHVCVEWMTYNNV